MTKKHFAAWSLLISFLTITACGGLRFHQLAPEGKNFHPRKIAILPIDVWNHKEVDSRAVVEQMVAGSLVEKKLFDRVMDAEMWQKQIQSNDASRDAVRNFFDKLRMLNYPDSALSQEIGRMAGIDAFLLIIVDEWKYGVREDTKTAQVGLTMELYDVATGKLMWKAGHDVTSEYVLIKTELPKVARDVVRKMIQDMPH